MVDPNMETMASYHCLTGIRLFRILFLFYFRILGTSDVANV